jgi:hypothetical protein
VTRRFGLCIAASLLILATASPAGAQPTVTLESEAKVTDQTGAA